jgi:hypothetical protein
MDKTAGGRLQMGDRQLRRGRVPGVRCNTPLLTVAVRVWLTEILIAGFNYFVLMQLVYEPRWGELVAHQIGMSTRIVTIFILAYLLLRYSKGYTTGDLVQVGLLWLALTLAFEWGGSALLRRPVQEILVGWNITKGYMWPFVLLSYLCANLIIGLLLHPGRNAEHETSPDA